MIITNLVISLLVLSRIDDHQLPASSPTPAPTTAQLSWQSDFLTGYQGRLGYVDGHAAEQLVTNAVKTCRYLNSHGLPKTWEYGTDRLGMSSDQTVVVIEEAIRTLCPQHTHLLHGGE
jgi:hypothetical protein